VANATAVSIGSGIGTVTGSSITVTPANTTTYMLTATNAAGTNVTATVTVGVRNNLGVMDGVPYPGGDADGTGSSATFQNPAAIAADGSGNLYVADTYNNEIRKVTPGGVVTTIAGGAALASPVVRTPALLALRTSVLSGHLSSRAFLQKLRLGAQYSVESTNSLIKNAGLSVPQGIAVSSDGRTIYVSDTGNGIIRKILIATDGSATMSTLAGTLGTCDSVNGAGLTASFCYPEGIAVDAGGNLYVADTGNSIIRKITAAGVVSTLAGTAGASGSADGTGPAASFSVPGGIAVDTTGNLYVADTGNNTIRKITSAGVVSTFAGTAGTWGSVDGTGSAASFDTPGGIAVDTSGNLYVADSGNDLIRKITPARVVSILAGSAGTPDSIDGTGSAARFDYPIGIAADTSGNLYVADTDNSTVRKITPAGVVSTLAGSANFGRGSADGSGSAASFNDPEGITADAAGNLFVADSGNDTIRMITSAGVVSTFAGTAGTPGSTNGTGAAAGFNYPVGIAVDSSGNLYIADSGNDTIRKITSAGVVSTLAGTAGTPGSANGTGATASFNAPTGIAVDAGGNLYVADTGNSTIRKITPAGVVTTIAGTAGTPGSADGTGLAASFYFPRGITVDTGGNLYIADSGNETIRKITSAGVVSTLAGTAGTPGAADGTGSAASFASPQGITLDSAGNLYVADINNNTIRKITPAGVVTTIIGSSTNPTASTGPLPASLYLPLAVAADSSGNLFITVPNAVLTLEQ
jgi:sugar lactone lactonase YvrE